MAVTEPACVFTGSSAYTLWLFSLGLFVTRNSGDGGGGGRLGGMEGEETAIGR